LNAIAGGQVQAAAVARLASMARTWLDAGISAAPAVRQALTLGAHTVVVGLETLRSFHVLAEMSHAGGAERIAFSLDLRDGVPLSADGLARGMTIDTIVRRILDAAVDTLIVLDLARVGTHIGLDFELIERVRRLAHDVTLVAGGGVGGLEDLRRLADAGCDGALVATAIVEGRLSVEDVAVARRYSGPDRPRAGR
jgi:phosphoribosylformimino-5-aminoimidazole carboxamide ribotide isomerase